ncbi:MAG: CDP-alcohol phosphatidyltransferase family protein [Aquificae bacterium]|nr:CDP-alcohol phosphatidyltransferase family protein [Aquificota bacterium]
MNVPNALSLLRILLSPLIPLLLLEGKTSLSFFLVSFLALTDFLDGYLARKTSRETTLGKILDPLGDKVFSFFCLMGYTYLTEPGLPPYLFWSLLLRDLFLTVGGIYLKLKGIVPEPSLLGKLTTFSVFFTVFLFALHRAFPQIGSPPSFLYWLSTLLVLLSFTDYTLRGLRLLRGIS